MYKFQKVYIIYAKGEIMITPDQIYRSNRQTLSLSVLKDGKVVVKAPLKMSNETISKFICEKQAWIQEKLAFLHNNHQKYDDIINYKKLLLFGNRYDIKFANVKKIQTSAEDMSVYIPKNTPEDKFLQKIKAWYKKYAKEILEDRVNYLSKIMKLTPTAIKINDTKGRWGACNSRDVVSFNFRVIMLEPSIIDYIIVHELCHLVEMNHSKKFWNLVYSFLPNAVIEKKKIKEYSFLLTLF